MVCQEKSDILGSYFRSGSSIGSSQFSIPVMVQKFYSSFGSVPVHGEIPVPGEIPVLVYTWY